MRNRLLLLFGLLAAIFCSLPDLCAQATLKRSAAGARTSARTVDLSGIWGMTAMPVTRAYITYAFTSDEPPMTAWGLAKLKEAKPSFGPVGYPIEQTNDSVYHGCYPPGVPRAYLHPFPFQLVQTPKEVFILYEYDHLVRHIRMNAKHDTDAGPTWMGDSIGKWEGNTLVVDTIGFNDKTWLDRMGHPHSEELHLVERFRRIGKDTLQIGMIIEDPKAYTRPWNVQLTYELKTDWKIMEQFCVDNSTFDQFEGQATAPGNNGNK